MATEDNKKKVYDPGLCRCCGVMKRCRLLNVEYECLGQKEVYCDMMMDCFGLLLSHLDGKPTERLVCATCVVQLRAACGFRRQVLRCEEAFLRMKMFEGDAEGSWGDGAGFGKLSIPKIEVEVVKTEPADETGEEVYSADDMPPHSDTDERTDAAKVEPSDETACPQTEDSNDDLPLLQRLTRRKTAAFPVRSARRAADVPGTRRTNADNTPVERVPKVAAKKPAPMSQIQQQHRERDTAYVTETNTLHLVMWGVSPMRRRVDRCVECQYKVKLHTGCNASIQYNLVEYSYVCPFKCRHNNLLCYYCGLPCADGDRLRRHTIGEHDPRKFKVVEHKKMIKVDVTRVDCRLCDEKIADIEQFKRHLTKRHNKKYYFGYTDSVLPFRLTNAELSCTLCDQKYPYFHALNKHMNVHFSNYVCETCGLGFVDKCRFVMHQQRHGEGDYPCELCGKGFRAQYNRDLHVDRVHKKKGRVYCPKCDMKLMSYPQKLKHLVEVHGEAPLSFPCNLCEKVYLTRRMLTIHRRKDHLKDYRYECHCCGQKFFTRFALNNHMPTHTGERNFKCKVCDKSYPRLKTLKDHMRIHSNDRRYRCHVCGQAFIQNCSLKGHIKTQHPEYM